MPPGRTAAAPARRIAPWVAASRAGCSGGLAPAQRRAGWRACRGPSRAGRRARGRRPPARARRRRRRRDLDAARAHPLRGARAARAARPRWRSTATTRPRSSISAARWVVLPPGAAHRSSTRSPGCGSSSARDHHRRARLRHEQALAPLGRPVGVERRLEHEPLGQAGRRRGWPPAGAAASSVGGGAQRVGAQRGLGGLVVGGHQRPRVRRARASPTTASAIHSGCEWRSAAACGRVVGQRRDQAAGLAGGAAQDRVDEPGAAARVLLGELARDSPTAAWAGTRSR